tara:strand:- start:1082 stop:1516 length:435 start_codon:yes stop_codon:yes gene_type:complete
MSLAGLFGTTLFIVSLGAPCPPQPVGLFVLTRQSLLGADLCVQPLKEDSMTLFLRSRVTVDGITATMAEHAERLGIGEGTLMSRMTRLGRHDPILLLEPATRSRKPVSSPSQEEIISTLRRTPAGLLATAKRLGDYASLKQESS